MKSVVFTTMLIFWLLIMNGMTVESKKKSKPKKAKSKSPESKKAGKGAPIKILNGKTVETAILPMVLECDPSYVNIDFASITINGKEADDKVQKEAAKECSKSLKKLKKSGSKETKCTVELGKLKHLTGKDIFRAVYQCNMGEIEHWDKEAKIESASEDKAGKSVKLKCKGEEVFNILSVTINNEETIYPELYTQAVEWDCNRQRAMSIEGGKSAKGNHKCEIENKSKYGGTLEIKYRCKYPERM